MEKHTYKIINQGETSFSTMTNIHAQHKHISLHTFRKQKCAHIHRHSYKHTIVQNKNHHGEDECKHSYIYTM
jgi:hypothetical protein